MCTPNVVVVVFLWLVPFSSAVFLEGPCKPFQEQSVATTVEKLRNVNQFNVTLLPVVITAPEKHSYSASLASSTFKTSFRFSATFGSGQCVDKFKLEVNEDQKAQTDFIIDDNNIQSGSTFVENDAYDKDWLVYFCQNVKNGHVVQLWILQRMNFMTRNSMRMDTLMDKYRKRIEQLGLWQGQLLSLAENEFEFCDEDLQNHFNRFERTLFWFRTVVLILIAVMLMITVAGFAIRFFNATAKLNKVRSFSAT